MRTPLRATAARIALLAAMALPASAGGQTTPGGSCVACHGAFPDDRLASPVKLFATDIHAERGFGCVACHGGDASAEGFESMDPARGFIGRPRGQTLLNVCGRCHSSAEFMRRYNPALRVDQVTEYLSSVHGQRLTRMRDTLVATCSSCHPAHQVRPPSDPRSSVHPLNVAATCGACHADSNRMRPYGIPTDQRDRYQRSVHWRLLSEAGDLSAPTCNDCHGNHGAAPPGVSWVGNVCGQCHATIADRFRESRHAQAFTAMGVPGCATCHGNHDIQEATLELLGLGDSAICKNCHVANDAGGTTAVAMRQLLDSLEARFDSAQRLLERAEHAGMEVSQARFDLDGAHNARIAARTAVHTFQLDAVRKEVEQGLAVSDSGVAAGHRALAELNFRRTGLAVSVTIIVALIAGLLLKIRQLEHGS
ncbi:MAG TPA: cytochrome c3 family protein [Gemmatimonadales bacterium]|nr:cytochrome c3 family protein [Gemmatimonadales bacterium]